MRKPLSIDLHRTQLWSGDVIPPEDEEDLIRFDKVERKARKRFEKMTSEERFKYQNEMRKAEM